MTRDRYTNGARSIGVNVRTATVRLAEALAATGHPPSVFDRRTWQENGQERGTYLRRGPDADARADVWAHMQADRGGVRLSLSCIAAFTATVHSTVSTALSRRAARLASDPVAATSRPPKPATPWREGKPTPPTRPVAPPATSYGVSGALIALGGDFPERKTGGPRRMTQTPDPWAESDRRKGVYAGRTTDVTDEDD